MGQMVNYHMKVNFSIIKSMEKELFVIRRKNMMGNFIKVSFKDKGF